MTHPLEATLTFARAPGHPVTEVSDTITGLLGYTPQQWLNGSVHWRALVHTDDQDITDWLFSPDLSPNQGDFNIRLRHGDGRIRCIKAHYRLLPPDSRPGGLRLHLTDARALHPCHPCHPAVFTPNFVAMLENTDDFIYFKDRHHVFTGASQTLVNITSPTQHWTDLIGKTDYDLFPEAYADLYYRLEKQVYAGNPVAHEVHGYLANDGHTGWVDNRKYPIADAHGKIIGLFGVARDISDLKHAERALLESEHRFKTMFEQLPSISVQGYDRQRRVIYWNRASEALYGYPREQALGRQLEDLIIPEPMREAVIGLVNAWSQGGPAIPSAELTLQDANGAPVEVFSCHVMLNSHAGEPEMYCIDIDISERKKAERAMRASEAFLRTIIDEIPDPLAIKDAQGKFLLGNRALADLYNTTPEAMVGQDDGDFGVPADLAEQLRQNAQAIMAQCDTQVVLEDSRDATTGEIRHYRSIKKPFRNIDGRSHLLMMAQDMTDVIRAQRQLAESEQRLQHVLGIIREGIWDWHVPTNHVVHNPQWYQTLLYTESDIPATMEASTALVHPDDRDMVTQRMENLMSGACADYYSEHRLLRKDGQVLWVQDRGRVVERDAQGQPVRVVGSFADISFQKEHQNYLERIAHYDTLTGLPNRVLLADRMQQAMVQTKRRGTLMAVAYLDLDGFKAVNDRYGHTVGDQLLTSLAGQLRAIMREGDTMARLGGDEFVAVFVDLPEMHSSVMLINRLLEVAARPVVLHDASLKVSASVGVSFYPQSDDTDADQLLRQADQAMYSAKLAGKNRFQLFDAEHDRSQRVRHETLQRITQAMADEEFVLYYQPKVNLRTGEVFGAEALIRWQHPQQGLLAPGRFLPDIESHAISLALGEWVLHTAMKQLAAWVAQGLNLSVSVNISAHHLPATTRLRQQAAQPAGSLPRGTAGSPGAGSSGDHGTGRARQRGQRHPRLCPHGRGLCAG